MKTSAQLKALIRNISKEKNVEAEIILRNFVFERLLERVSISKYRNNFILKGGILIAAIVGIDTRTTMDLDAVIKGRPLTEQEVKAIIGDLLNIAIEDNVKFTLRNIEEIREESEYPGYRVSIDTVFDKTKQTIKVDIATGDLITPNEIEFNYKLMFDNRTISILTYNIETILAEKFETVISRGVANSRMRDFYDIYILTTTQGYNEDLLRESIKNTIKRRKTETQMADAENVIEKVALNADMGVLWQRYRKKYSYAKDIEWEKVIFVLKKLATII